MPNDKAYTVNDKIELTQINKQTGEVYTAWRIWATSRGGTYYHIDVPAAELEQAPALLQAKAKELDAIL